MFPAFCLNAMYAIIIRSCKNFCTSALLSVQALNNSQRKKVISFFGFVSFLCICTSMRIFLMNIVWRSQRPRICIIKTPSKVRVSYWQYQNDLFLICPNWLTDFVVVVKNIPCHCQIHVSRHHHKWQKVLHCYPSKLEGITQLYHKSFNKQVAAVFSVSVNIDFDFDCPSHLIQNMSISQWEVFLAKQRKWGSNNEESVAKKTKSATNSAQN